jgi:hypothetical protein
MHLALFEDALHECLGEVGALVLQQLLSRGGPTVHGE